LENAGKTGYYSVDDDAVTMQTDTHDGKWAFPELACFNNWPHSMQHTVLHRSLPFLA
jgi:hypothetical protein